MVELIARVDLPGTPVETGTLVWLRVATSPEDDVVAERETLRANWSTLLRVTSVEADEP